MLPSRPQIGLAVGHLFWTTAELTDAAEARSAIAEVRDQGDQVVCAAMLGHKADLCTMVLAADQWTIRRFQTAMTSAGFVLADSYLSLTESSEYAAGLPEEMKQARLYPQLPPEGKPAFCFYPMSKRRNPDANWFTLDFEARKSLMYEHGTSGRKFAGRVLQVVTGSTGIDDYEWGVTLFCEHPDDMKDVVYTLRYDEASARYGEFGTFYVGMVASDDEVWAALGLGG
ncbi:MAG: chlorite dismutase family protein [Microthrixaceae bacterium]